MALRGEQYRRFLQVIPNPAAGAEIDFAPFGQGDWRIMAVIFTLATSAAAGTRAVQLSATDGTTEWWRAPVVSEIGPSGSAVFAAHPGVVGAGAAGAESAKQVTSAFAATGNGTAALGAGDSITGFVLNLQAVGAAAQVDVTVTNVLGGTQTYRITCPTTGAVVPINFPDPIPAATGLVAPTVNFPGAAGTPAGSIVAFGRSSTLDNVSNLSFPDEGIFLRQGWHLRTLTAARDVADQYSAIAVIVEELPTGPDWSAQPLQGTTAFPLDS